MTTIKKPPIFQYVCLAIVFAVACAYQVRATLYSFPDYFHIQAVAWPFIPIVSHGQPHVSFVNEAAQKAGVKDDDILVAVNGHHVTGLAVFGEAMRLSKPGEVLTATVSSSEQSSERTVSIPLEQRRSPSFVPSAILDVCVKFLVPVFCILLGSWVVAVRPRDPSAWLLFLTLQFFSVFYMAGNESWGPGLRDLGVLYRIGLITAWPIFMLLFGIYFPEPFAGKDAAFWNWVKRLLIPALILHSIAAIIVNLGELENVASVASLSTGLERLSKVAFLLSFLATGSFFACIGMKSGMAATPDAKRRLRLLRWGTTISMTPACILFVVQAIRGGHRAFEEIFPVWFVLFALGLLLLFPLTLAYAIVVHRAMDVRVVIREGLQYALARAGVRVLQVALGAIVLAVAIQLALDPQRSKPQRFIPIAFGIFIVVRLRRVADRVRQWVDRRFFRDAYGAEQILESLSEELRTILEKRPLLERVATRLSESLHVPRVAVLLEENGCYRPAFALGYPGALDAGFLESSMTVRQLKREAVPERIFLDDEKSWVNGPGVAEEERRQLTSLQPQVLLPLSVKEKLLGIISLGEKRAEAPYSGSDLRVLKTVAAQTALALSNAELTSAIAHEIAGREKLNREIEIAREVQERLFPQHLPKITGLDYFGLCRTALGVGGDYYDFLALPEGKLGVALGDVSGKGIAAALTMASLQASLRADAMRAGDDIGSLINRVNSMLYDASTEDRYATLFYAQFDPATRRLSYVNAGHCPPILVRSAESAHAANCPQVERLDKAGGTVVGLIPECSYEQAGATLSSGDLLVIYTDGFSEAMNPELEEWGEERLIEAIKACNGFPAKEIITRILESADAYASGAPQSDDMTLVILRAL
jgi:sigma-B regulation protein RsbU (phosphoserine phosphatase)